MDTHDTETGAGQNVPQAGAVTIPPPGGSVATAVGADQEPPRKRRLWIWLLIAAIAAGALGVGGYLAFGEIQAQRSASEDIDEASRLLESADAIVIEVDEVVRTEIDTELGDRAQALRGELPAALDDLREAISLVDGALVDLPDADAPYALALKASAEPRIEMLELADGLLEANVKAAAALDPAVEAWDLVLEAEAISDQAVAKYNDLTKESVTESVELSTRSEELIGKAKGLFSEAATGFPEADFEGYVSYCEGKLELLALSKKADTSWLAGKIVEANTTISQYNEKETAVIELAKTLPDSPVEVVATAYQGLAEEDTTSYFETRQKATEADAALQELGGA